jgi:acetyltransferase-like isoleucine patch superfamily enzyme
MKFRVLRVLLRFQQLAIRQVWKAIWGSDLAIGNNVYISPTARLEKFSDGILRGGKIRIGDNCVLSHGVILAPYGGEIVLEPGSLVSAYTVLYGHGNLRIGSKTMIAAHCVLVPANHGIAAGRLIFDQPESRLGIVVGKGVWIGAGCKVLDGVTIADGAVLAAGAVVTADVPMNSVVAGVPARVVKIRS